MEITEFVDMVLSIKNKKITDEVFLLIQNDHELMKDYLELVHTHGTKTLNSQIGRQVAHKYGLNKTESEAIESEPQSTLIYSHHIFD